MIAPGPDDRPGKLRWVFGSNRVERSETRAAFGPAGWSNRDGRNAFGWFGRNGAEGRTSQDDPNEANARFLGLSGPRSGAIREGRSAFGQFDRNGAKGGTSQDDPNGAKRETWRRLRTARAYRAAETRKRGQVARRDERIEVRRQGSRWQHRLPNCVLGRRSAGHVPLVRHPGLVPGSAVPRANPGRDWRRGRPRDKLGVTV